MTQIIENIEAHYETHEVPFGRTYEWHQAHVILECDCGERLTLTGSSTATCPRCGADYTDIFFEQQNVRGQSLRNEILHPWRYAGDREDVGLPF